METKKRRRSPGSSGEEDTFSLSGDISSSTEDASSDLSGAGAARASKTSPTCLQLDASLLRKARRIETEARRVSLSVKDFALVSPSRGDGSPDGADAAEGVKRQLRLWQRLVALRVKMETALQRVRLLPEAPLLRRLEKNVDASDVNHKLLVQSLLGSTGGGGCLGEVSASPGSSSSSSFSVESAKVRAAALFAQLRLLQTRLLLCSSLADDSSKSGLPAFDFEIEERQGAEAAVWNCVGDGLFSQGLRSLLLRILDDWNRSVCSSTAGKFASLSQNLSSQVQGAMKAEREKLLSRHLKTAHVPVDGKCAVLGCLDSSAPPPKSHATYDDGGCESARLRLMQWFYLNLLKDAAEAHGTEVSASLLQSEKEAARRRGKEFQEKKAVDRRASKGRALRYTAIPQLENFVSATPWRPNLEAFPGAADSAVVAAVLQNLFALN